MLPEGWCRRRLGEVAHIASGGTPDRAEPSYWNGGIPWVTTGEIQFNTITDTAEKITAAGLESSSARLFPPGTLLLAMYGQGRTRGQVAKLGIEAATNQACAAIRLKPGHDPDFYFHVLASNYDSIRSLGNTGTQRNLSAAIIKEIEVPAPCIAEQRRIAQVLACWDDAIATTERMLANLRRQRRALVRELLAPRGPADPARRARAYADLGDVFERVTRKNAESNTNVLTISGERGLVNQREFFSKYVASDNISTYTVLRKGEFAYNKSQSSGYPFGAIKPLTRYDSGVVSGLYICFRLRDGVDADPEFYRHYLEGGLLDEGLSGIAQEGARSHGLLNVGIDDFFKLRLHVPDGDEQRRIARILGTAESEERLVFAQLSKLREEKRGLMQRLLTGRQRLRVPEREAELIA
jgi:type I restriction enzyme S subunit